MACKQKIFIQTSLAVCLLMIIVLCHTNAEKTSYEATKVSVIVNHNSRIGKEAKVAMEIAGRNINNSSAYDHKVFLQFHAPDAAAGLVRKKDVQLLVFTEPLVDSIHQVGEIGNQAQVPVISFASDALPQQFKSLQWPYLVQMSSNVTEQIQCVAAIIRYFKWRKIITINELDTYGSDSGTFATLSDALLRSGVDIEHRSLLPPFTSIMSDPQSFIRDEVKLFASKNSRVFIVLRSSMSMAAHIFNEAKRGGLMGIDSTWIVLDDIASLLQYSNTSVISSMEGVIGIKPYYSEESPDFLHFKYQFKKAFQLQYPFEDNLDISIHALRAYDSVAAVARASVHFHKSNINNTKYNLRNKLLSDQFTSLSSNQIHLDCKELSPFSVYRLVNVGANSYTNIGIWSPEFGFVKSHVHLSGSECINGSSSMEVLADAVRWPGGLNRVPRGWSMPYSKKKLLIGVPGRTSFEKFVKVDWNRTSSTGQHLISGYCIDVFSEVLKILEKSYPLPFEYKPHNCTYDRLIDYVANETYDAIIGDITILANRSKYVEFTQPYAESGLTMIVPVKGDTSRIFVRPFTTEMWALTLALLMYTVLIVWLLESRSNPEFQGSWQDQLSVAVWFTFSSIFFAQREQVRSNYTRVVAFVWFIVVLALTTSYTASLSSLFTINRLRPAITDIDWLRTNNATIGCDGDSFVWRYLQDVLQFKAENIKNVSSEYNYPGEFASGNISAAFLELPYEKAFLNYYCKDYTVPKDATYKGDRFGGLGFVFVKGSPMALDVSEALLILSENGILKQLHEQWFSPSSKCRALLQKDLEDSDSLNWKSFWGLYLFSASISTISYLLFMAHRFYQHYYHRNNEADADARVQYIEDEQQILMLERYHSENDIQILSPVGVITPGILDEEQSLYEDDITLNWEDSPESIHRSFPSYY